jgi:hypothetical protein
MKIRISGFLLILLLFITGSSYSQVPVINPDSLKDFGYTQDEVVVERSKLILTFTNRKVPDSYVEFSGKVEFKGTRIPKYYRFHMLLFNDQKEPIYLLKLAEKTGNIKQNERLIGLYPENKDYRYYVFIMEISYEMSEGGTKL